MGAVTRTEYAPHEIDKALTVLAYYGNNSARASRETGIPATTLKDWRNTVHRDRYIEIAERERPRLEAIAANEAVEIMLKAADREHDILDRMEDAETSKELSELAGAFQRVATAKGINTTKLLELTGRPTQVVEHRDPKQAAQALARRLGVTLEGTATEIPISTLPSGSVDANARDTAYTQTAD